MKNEKHETKPALEYFLKEFQNKLQEYGYGDIYVLKVQTCLNSDDFITFSKFRENF